MPPTSLPHQRPTPRPGRPHRPRAAGPSAPLRTLAGRQLDRPCHHQAPHEPDGPHRRPRRCGPARTWHAPATRSATVCAGPAPSQRCRPHLARACSVLHRAGPDRRGSQGRPAPPQWSCLSSSLPSTAPPPMLFGPHWSAPRSRTPRPTAQPTARWRARQTPSAPSPSAHRPPSDDRRVEPDERSSPEDLRHGGHPPVAPSQRHEPRAFIAFHAARLAPNSDPRLGSQDP